jgi:hypothetical protein
MKTKIGISLIASAILASGISANTSQSISVKTGWNLVGSYVDSASSVLSSNSNVQIAWSWDASTSTWKGVSSDSAIQSKIASATEELTTINAGDGFWVKATSDTALSLNGSELTDIKSLEDGWNLVSFKVEEDSNKVEDVFSSNDNLKTIWEYDNNTSKWKAWSNISEIQKLITDHSEIGTLTTIANGKGYWIHSTDETVVNSIVTPPADFIYINQTVGETLIASLSNANIYNSETEELIGKTDDNGKLSISGKNLDPNTPVKAMKDDYTSNVGMLKNGFVSLSLMPLSDSITTDMVAKGANLPLKNYGFISDDYATVEVAPSEADESLTFAMTAYKSGISLPKIDNAITLLDGEEVAPNSVSVIGAANISLKKSDGTEIINLSNYDGKLDFSYKLEKFIGNLEDILNGKTEVTGGLKTFNQESFNLLKKGIEDEVISLYLVQQQVDGTWKELAKAKPIVEANKVKLVADMDGKITTFGGGNVAYIIKTEFVTGSTNVCFEQQGYRMNNGMIVEENENNNSKYDWIGKPVKNLVLIGDENVIGQSAPSSETGCTLVNYKVPLLNPMYQITAVSEGNFDKTVTINIDFDNLNKAFDDNNVSIYKIPDKVTIEGHVKSTCPEDSTPKGVGRAIVTLQDPQILTKDKVLITEENSKKIITLEENPNVVFTYTLTKEDDTENSVEIKTGTLGEIDGVNKVDKINVLTQDEVEDIIYSTDDSKNKWINSPYGNYIIAVKAVHHYANNDTLTEEALVTFTAKLDESALLNAFSVSANQGNAPWYKVESDNSLVELTTDSNDNNVYDDLEGKDLGTLSIFGGKDLSMFNPVFEAYGSTMSEPDSQKWDSYVLSYGSELGTGLTLADSSNPYLKTIMEANAKDQNATAPSSVKKILETSLSEQQMLFSQLYKLFSENYDVMTGTDLTMTTDYLEYFPNNQVGDKIPLYQSGFTVANIYQATFNKGDTKYRTYGGSYTNLDTNKLTSVDDFSDILDFNLMANEATAYSSRYTMTEDENTTNDNGIGYYHISQISPEVIPFMEITARAEGHEYGVENERLTKSPDSINDGAKNVDENATAGDVLKIDFNLNKIACDIQTVTPPIAKIKPTLPWDLNQTFENDIDNGWEVINFNIANVAPASKKVKWHVVEDGALPKANDTWLSNYGYTDDQTTILPTPYGDKYIWMGHEEHNESFSAVGSYADNGPVATALKSPVVDFTDYSLGVLNFKQWFEVSAYDASWDTAFVGFELQADENNTAGTQIALEDAMGAKMYLTVGQTYVTRITPSSPVINSVDTTTYYSNKGLNIEPAWQEFKLKLDMLAGQKARIVFGFVTADTLYNNNRGWGVDDIFIQDDVNDTIELPPLDEIIEMPVLEDNVTVDINETIFVDINNTNENNESTGDLLDEPVSPPPSVLPNL